MEKCVPNKSYYHLFTVVKISHQQDFPNNYAN